MASMLARVSWSVSPFTDDDELAAMARVSAREALGGQFEGGAGARAGFVEPVHHEAALEQGHLLDAALALGNGHELGGGVED
jgi:hypothetical protein